MFIHLAMDKKKYVFGAFFSVLHWLRSLGVIVVNETHKVSVFM